MKSITPARRVLAAGAVSALAAGALVVTTATTASAAPISNDYICQGSTGPFPMNLSSDIPILAAVPEIGAGTDVPAEFLEVQNTVTVPTAVIDGLSGLGITRVEAPDFAGTFGATVVGVDGVGADVADATPAATPGFSSLQADGFNAAFEVPAAGTYDVVSPTSVELVAKNSAGTAVSNVPCELADGETAGSYATVEVLKNDSTTKGKSTKKSFKKGKAAAVAVTVKADNQRPTGTVQLKKGKKVLDKAKLKKGKATLSTKKLKVGSNKLTVVYKGDGYTSKSEGKVTVKVKK